MKLNHRHWILFIGLLGACEEAVGNPALSSRGDADRPDVDRADIMMTSCPPPQTDCSGQCVTVEVSPEHCGACGRRCAAGQLCAAGACVSNCVAPSIACGGGCVNPSSDNEHCGACDSACSAEQRCNAGTCTCLAGLTTCGSNCVDTQNDPQNCGACGRRCNSGQNCASGRCQTPPRDPCEGVPTSGTCASASSIQFCSVSTGTGGSSVQTISCAVGERCQLVGGRATCVLTAPCREDDRRCGDSNTLQICQSGSWRSSNCPRGCISTAIDEGCAPDIALRSTPLSGRITYEVRGTNTSFTDWGSAFETPAQGFLVAIVRPDSTGTPQFIDTQITTTGNDSSGGRYSVRVPAVTTSQDQLVILAVGVDEARRLVYVVGDPMFPTNTAPQNNRNIPSEARIWLWSAPLNTLADNDTVTIRTSNGSGAARVFDYMRYVYNVAADHYRPSEPETLVAWVGLDTYWQCGACFSPSPTTRWGIHFKNQIWIRGGRSRDEGYWSDAVTAHELGHYVMSAFGQSPNEGGAHTLGVPTNPGQAWSEGWATFFSSRTRGDTRYYDKQNGYFFSLDIARRTYSSGVTWRRPLPILGLMQLMDENEVSSMLWGLSRDATGGSITPFLTALSSPRMNTSPFLRGYFRRIWPNSDPVDPANYVVTDESRPMVSDMFDALLCGRAVAASALDRVTEPTVRYPFPSDRPLCREGQSPIRAILHAPEQVSDASAIDVAVEISRDALYELPVEVSINLPQGVRLVRGASSEILSAERQPTTSRRSWTFDVAQIPQQDLVVTVRVQDVGFSFYAPLHYGFGRHVMSPNPLVRNPLHMHLRGIDVGEPIQLSLPNEQRGSR